MRVEDLKANIEKAVEEKLQDYFDIKNFLENNKIVITVVKGPEVLTKVIKVEVSKPKKRSTPISKQVVEQVKIIKKAVKVNADTPYIMTLLEQLEKQMKTFDFNSVDAETAHKIREEAQHVTDILSTKVLQIEHQKEETKTP